jgi:hypothetical protein
MTPRELAIRQRLKDDFSHYALKCLKIRTKSGKVEPFVLNKAQKFIHAQLSKQKESTRRVRAICLKGRQQGCSTLIAGRYYHIVTHHKGFQAFILTHALDATQNLYKMAQRYYENTPILVRPEVSTSNAKELVFGALDSGYKLGTAENKAVGRSSTIQLLHGSEVAFWANAAEHAKGVMQAVPNEPGTEIILESTANGMGNYFHQQWQLAESLQSEFTPIFVPWFWQDEYKRPIDERFQETDDTIEIREIYKLSDEQLYWRQNKIAELSISGIDGAKAFKQEYPNNSTEAFQITGEDSFIEAELVMKCRKSIAEAYGPLYIGVDPARFGSDRTSIIRRQGRKSFDIESYVKKDVMEVVGLVVQIIQKEKPVKVFIDAGGLGAGVIDRLHELGYKHLIVPVNFGGKPYNNKVYANKRAEMWGELKEWLSQDPCQIPDSDSLHADLCNIKYRINSNSQLLMEAKEDMKKRGIRSSDEGDALALTFAYPEQLAAKDSQKDNLSAKIMGVQNALLDAKDSIYNGSIY